MPRFLASVPGLDNGGNAADPLRHGHRGSRDNHYDGVLVRRGHRLDQLVLTGRQIHGWAVETLRLELRGIADHDDGGVGFPREIDGRVAKSGSAARVLAWHGDPQRVADLHPRARSLLDAVERRDGVLRPDQ